MKRKPFGVRTFEDIVARCRVDSSTGCMLWGFAVNDDLTPVMYLAPGVLGNEKGKTIQVRRAAWLMSGHKVAAQQSVYLARDCSYRCVNPKHCASGSKADAAAAAAARGAFFSPERVARLRRNHTAQAVPASVVHAIADACANGMLAKDAAQAFGVHKQTAAAIMRGKHLHQRALGLNGASVFAWRPA